MDDAQIIELYWSRDARAIAETECKYGAYCLTVARNILSSPEDAEECVNSTWLQAWNTMPPHRLGRLRLFLARITRNLSFNRYNELHAAKRGCGELSLVLDELAECADGKADVAGEYEARELGVCIRQFVSALPEREAGIFIRRYFFTEPIADIARQFQMSAKNVAVTLSRTRNKLKDHLRKEGYTID